MAHRSTVDARSAAVCVLAFGLAAALALLPGEVAAYARELDLPGALRGDLALAALAKTLAALALGAVPVLLLARWGSARAARGLGVAWTLGVVGWLLLDLAIEERTGRHLAHFARFLEDSDPLRWAGTGLDVAPLLLASALRWGAVACAAAAAAWAFGRIARLRGVLVGLGAAWAGGVLAGPLLLASRWDPARQLQAEAVLPWTLRIGPPLGGALSLDAVGTAAQRIYERHAAAGPVGPLASLPAPAERPHVVLVVLESLRHDVFDAEVMPNLVAFAERGTRFERHYAGSNASHFGLFALLYGRAPLDYFAEMEAGEPPTLVERLRGWGYTSHHLSSAPLGWKRMERFLGADQFALRVDENGPIWERDRRSLARARRLLGAHAPPRLVLVYLMSTHFGYHFPPGRAPFQPSAPPPNALDAHLREQPEALQNRYRNAAHSLDAILGGWLPSLDLEHTLVAITGDHGESLFDDGTLSHMGRLSEIQTRVPLVLAGPGVAAGRVVREPTSHVDVLPMLLGRLAPQALVGLPGRDVLAGRGSGYAVLVQSQLRERPERDLVFVGADERFWVRIARPGSRLDFLGKLDADAAPLREPLRDAEGRRFLDWLRDFLIRGNGRVAQALRKSPSGVAR